MSFEATVNKKVSKRSKHDKPETDLDFYARPENYEGSNIFTLNRFVLAKKKEGDPNKDSRGDHKEDRLTQLFDRYKDICDDIDEENGDATDGDKPVETSCSHASKDKHYNNDSTKSATDLQARRHTTLSGGKAHTSDGNDTSRLYQRRRSVTAPPERTPFHSLETPRVPTDTKDDENMDNRKFALRTPTPTSSRPATARSEFAGSDSFRTLSLQASSRSKQLSYLMARQRFKHAIKIVLILLKWISSLTEREEDEASKGGKTFTDIATEAFAEGELKASGIAFDVSQFKARKELNISKEVKHILSIPSSHRTPEQLQIALYGLQHLKSFAEYPLHMQEKLCKVAWYQQVPPKRVIIRQGHYAENFYFILSGQAVVRILDKNKHGDIQLRTAAVMRKGTSFGELALLHHSRRTATVVSQDTVQLLTIGREDFFDIFMKVSEEDGIPEHVRFVYSLDFMKFFPLEALIEHPEVCLFHFFKRGVVIVKNSNESDWLYIVKSGSCQVMKQLKGVRPHAITDTKDEPERPNGTLTKLPKLGGLGKLGGKTDSGLRKHATRPYMASAVRRAIVQYDNYLTQQEVESSNNKANKENHMTNGDAVANEQNKRSSPALEGKSPAEDKPVGFSKSKYNFLVPNHSRKGPHTRSYKNNASLKPSQSRSPKGSASAHFERSHTLTPRSLQPSKQEVEQPETPMEPVFVQVDTLKPKDVFGLASIQFDDDVEETNTSVSLVSNGAECIMLSKKFFTQHANEHVKHTIRQLVRPYPTDNSLQNNLQTKVDWDQFKRKLLVDTVVHLPIADSRRPTTVPAVRSSVHF